MNGLLHHMLLTLRLNFRSKQALIYGFVFPIGFLFAFWGIYYHKENPPLINEMGQLLTVTILSGACFGMPTAMVGERERGVWRRYRLLPGGTGGIVLSAMVVRTVLVALAIILQLVLAHFVCGANWPEHPARLAGVFFFVMFGFLGLGMVIATLADNVPAVQALGQAIFLPMVMIGGIGVRLDQLPDWARHIAAFLPGVYAVDAIDWCMRPKPMSWMMPLGFCLGALVVIGAAGIFAGRQMFRWDVRQPLTGSARAWVSVAIVAWIAVGMTAEQTGKVRSRRMPAGATVASGPTTTPATAPATGPTSRPVENVVTAPTSVPSSMPSVAKTAPWMGITDEQIADIRYDDLDPDNSTVTPLASSLDELDEDGKKRMEDFTAKLDDWEPGDPRHEFNTVQRVRNLLAVCAIADVLQDQYEAQIPYVVFDKIRFDVPEDRLKKVLTWIILHPTDDTVPTKVPALGIEGEVFEEGVRERSMGYAKKLLGRVVGKLP